MALRTVAHADEPVYDLPAIAVVVVFGAAVLAICGALGLVFARRPVDALVSAPTTFLLLFGVLAIASIGFLFLIAAAAMVIVRVRNARRSHDRVAVLSGVALSVGLIATLVVSLQPPIVKCSAHGVSTSTRSWWGGSSAASSSGSTSGGPNGTVNGSVSEGSRTYSFTCRDGRLDTFNKV